MDITTGQNMVRDSSIVEEEDEIKKMQRLLNNEVYLSILGLHGCGEGKKGIREMKTSEGKE